MKSETRRLNKLKDESRNIAKRYKLPETAAEIIERAGKIHGQQSPAIQVAVEILWRSHGPTDLSGVMESPLIGKTYKLPPRTVGCIETLAEESGMTRGGVLAAVAKVLAEPEPKREPLKF